MATFSLVLAAAGRGKRFGGATKKQFLPFRGYPLYQHSLRTFLTIPAIEQAVIVVGHDDKNRLQSEIRSLPHRERIFLTLGGEHRHLSVLQGIRSLSHKTDFVLVHDAARPLIALNDILTIIDKASASGSAILPCERVQDTIKVVKGERVLKSLNRESLAAASTPQCMPVDALLKGYQECQSINRIPTDDAEIVFETGSPVIVHWLQTPNPKITTHKDLDVIK